ncbi:kinesin-like protein KIN-7K, chloroplastic [Abrus precatorius]|uniref:Kinesin-like protein KIN-7K, chloroplastic n=1 Tax=Abrus precatorius TaxID=3816 RepID=A0A8B8LA56_ABRPR|nr:kinesin-like protein KIN-7K, chloroplastic [Abrus precatorius]XP_027353215.1 kinesin-like protein KIN-7K, chloroplastic [Abrus precatorius]XP_027353216.1 kinesin-like protein KIN-7K, chloroplastic [Abrus precatorius]XP_027353217.1 kinesin-like protein KIN-7K, chloroplastic [Abrus precatorius]
MASKQGVKTKRFGLSGSKGANSPSSSTTSSSKQFQETSVDGQSSPASSSARSKPHQFYPETAAAALDTQRAKENVTVTVRFRPLNPREIRQGEEIAWYADGETIVRNEYNPSLAYAYDRVFGPTTTTRQVYDVAAQHVVSGAMEGINGTVFAYGVTSSGKTHTMHGDQRSPGIIPLAVKDAFSIIQETPNREFLLRVSYLEIYNEVVNDLLNPAGQNLRIREDAQGTYVEGVKEEVVLSPAHALSLIAAGEEHRHVGSTNFNLLSSRSHTIFTLTIESSPCGENSEGEAVTLSQLNLIDLAGSESSKAETTGMRRREGSYINKSLLTLGTVISKLTEDKASHIPYRDSKLTRVLQSSLSGHGRVSLICTVTPSSSSTEETHNTLKFAHRAKHIEIRAAQNKIIDEKSLIKKYQQEIQCLREELEQLKRGIVTVQPKDTGDDDIELLKQKLEDGQVKLQSRLEQEEEAKAALLGRIQRLTKLILVSTNASQSTRFPNRPGPRRRHSFGEEELAYLPHKRRDLILDEENIDLYVNVEGNAPTADDSFKDEKKTKKHGLLNWLKLRKRDSALTGASDKSSGAKSTSTPSTPQAESGNHVESRLSHSQPAESSPSADLVSEAREDKYLHEDSLLGQETPLTSMKSVDQIDLLREQHKILSGEVALHSSALKRLSEEATGNPQNAQIHVEMKRLKDEIKVKSEQIDFLEKQISNSFIASDKTEQSGVSQTVSELMAQLNEKSFDLEVKAADNRIIQEQLSQKIRECENQQETISSLKQQLADALELINLSPVVNRSHFSVTKDYHGEPHLDKGNVTINNTNEGIHLQAQVSEIEELKQRVAELTESKEQLEFRNQKLAEESSYAKGLASAAAVELKALSEEVAKLMNQNERLTSELAASKNSPTQRRTSGTVQNGRRESHVRLRRNDQGGSNADIKRELALIKERELSYESALLERDQKEAELQRKIEESKQREAYLENELANMWVLVAKLKKSHGAEIDVSGSTKESLQLDGFGI